MRKASLACRQLPLDFITFVNRRMTTINLNKTTINRHMISQNRVSYAEPPQTLDSFVDQSNLGPRQ